MHAPLITTLTLQSFIPPLQRQPLLDELANKFSLFHRNNIELSAVRFEPEQSWKAERIFQTESLKSLFTNSTVVSREDFFH